MKCYYDEFKTEVGVDEAGAGCLAGPVFAAAVIWSNTSSEGGTLSPLFLLIKDSKKLSEKKREIARKIIEEYAVSYSITSLDAGYVDKNNILNSRIDCMQNAIRELKDSPRIDTILVDGDKFKDYYTNEGVKIDHKCVIKGDNEYISIAAASILAKTERDRYMKRIDLEYPVYNWKCNNGYGTKEHYLTIKENGITEYHRKTFRLY
jgi:ribonuclease HII